MTSEQNCICDTDTVGWPQRSMSLPPEELIVVLIRHRKRYIRLKAMAKRMQASQAAVAKLEKKCPSDWELRELVDYHFAITNGSRMIDVVLKPLPTLGQFTGSTT